MTSDGRSVDSAAAAAVAVAATDSLCYVTIIRNAQKVSPKLTANSVRAFRRNFHDN